MPENDPLQEKVWTGRFVFDLKVHPEQPRHGWLCGYRRWSNDPTGRGRVDIALVLPEDSKRFRIHSNQVSFNFLPETGVFAIRAIRALHIHPVFVDASRVDCHNRLRVLDRPRQIVDVGEATYEFKYDIDNEAAFIEARARYLRTTMHQSSPLICDTPTPSEDDIHVGKWRLLGTVGRGSESVVVSAMSSEGKLVVVKTLDKIRFHNQRIDQEIRRYRKITETVKDSEESQYLLAFLESIAGDHSTYLFFSPHARHDFGVLLSNPRLYSRQLHTVVLSEVHTGGSMKLH